MEENREANYPYSQSVTELRKTQINVAESKDILKAPQAAVAYVLSLFFFFKMNITEKNMNKTM